jgi:hypothetical protein
MNKLIRDRRRLVIAATVVAGCTFSLGILKVVQLTFGLKEQEFYGQFPVAWYVVVTLGSGFTGGLLYSVLKMLSIDPNIQLRSKSDDFLKNILADKEYEPWHNEAQQLLERRGLEK